VGIVRDVGTQVNVETMLFGALADNETNLIGTLSDAST